MTYIWNFYLILSGLMLSPCFTILDDTLKMCIKNSRFSFDYWGSINLTNNSVRGLYYQVTGDTSDGEGSVLM